MLSTTLKIWNDPNSQNAQYHQLTPKSIAGGNLKNGSFGLLVLTRNLKIWNDSNLRIAEYSSIDFNIYRWLKSEKRVIRNLKILEFEDLQKIEKSVFRNLAVAKIRQFPSLPNDGFKSDAHFLHDSQKFKNGWFCIDHQKLSEMRFHPSARNSIAATIAVAIFDQPAGRNLKICDFQFGSKNLKIDKSGPTIHFAANFWNEIKNSIK
jgi:hypothetical protein